MLQIVNLSKNLLKSANIIEKDKILFKSKNSVILSKSQNAKINIKVMRFLIFKAKVAFIQLKKMFIKTLIL